MIMSSIKRRFIMKGSEQMTGKLYVIGVGPGDPELLTLKAIRILKEVPCICVPKGKEEGSSLALSIIKKAINIEDKEIIEAHFPMKKTRSVSSSDTIDIQEKWHETITNISNKLSRGIDMAFITLGDPTIYSTFFYLFNRLLSTHKDLNLEIIPGISSINASASKAKISLGLADDKIAIIPATYSIDKLGEIIQKFDTIVLMKVHRVFDKIIELIKEMDLLKNTVYIKRAAMEDERIFKDITKITKDDLDYFSLLIITK